MSDDGMDPCECIWGHELAMRRLLSLLRQSQSLCTDTECFDNPLQQTNGQQADGNFLVLSLMIVIAIALYLLRPRTLTAPDKKAHNSGSDSNGTPPSAPPATF